jgi:hypothetical protein
VPARLRLRLRRGGRVLVSLWQIFLVPARPPYSAWQEGGLLRVKGLQEDLVDLFPKVRRPGQHFPVYAQHRHRPDQRVCNHYLIKNKQIF